MREIKFRAWEEVNKVMHLDFRFIKSGDEGNDWLIFTSDKQTLQDKHHPFDNPWFQQQFKIMQYTGLKDANGVEIYEGDIVEQYHFTDFSGKVHNILHRVVWSEKYDGWLCLNCKSNDENDGSCQLWVYSKTPFIVAGNIYQNSDLLS